MQLCKAHLRPDKIPQYFLYLTQTLILHSNKPLHMQQADPNHALAFRTSLPVASNNSTWDSAQRAFQEFHQLS